MSHWLHELTQPGMAPRTSVTAWAAALCSMRKVMKTAGIRINTADI